LALRARSGRVRKGRAPEEPPWFKLPMTGDDRVWNRDITSPSHLMGSRGVGARSETAVGLPRRAAPAAGLAAGYELSDK
jgi:hypothetical protein